MTGASLGSFQQVADVSDRSITKVYCNFPSRNTFVAFLLNPQVSVNVAVMIGQWLWSILSRVVMTQKLHHDHGK